MMQYVTKHEKEIKALGVITLPALWKKKPALLLNHLLDTMGYKHSSTRARLKGKLNYIYKCQTVDANEALSTARLSNGQNWVESTDLLIDLYDSTEIRKVS
jgi:hypothetical protein